MPKGKLVIIMKKQSIVLLVVLAIFATSCKLTKTTSIVRELEPKTNVLVADLEVKTEKVVGEFQYKMKKRMFLPTKMQELIDDAIYNALIPANADVLVGATTQVVQESRPFKTFYTITVSGYPAYYRNFRHEYVKDLELKEINGAVYVIPRNADKNAPMGYQVIVPTDKYARYIDLNQITVDKILFDPAESQLPGNGEVTNSAPIKEETKVVKISKKKNSKSKNKKSKK